MSRKKKHSGMYATLGKLVLGALACAWVVSVIPLEGVITEFQVAAPLGALFAGALLVSMFTVVLGTVFIGFLAQAMPLWQLVILAGLGSVIVDGCMFLLFRKTMVREATPFFRKWRNKPIIKLFRSKYMRWALPLFGAALIASPLPDELGVGLLGASGISMKRFIAISFVMDCLGVLVLALSARVIV